MSDLLELRDILLLRRTVTRTEYWISLVVIWVVRDGSDGDGRCGCGILRLGGFYYRASGSSVRVLLFVCRDGWALSGCRSFLLDRFLGVAYFASWSRSYGNDGLCPLKKNITGGCLA